jgi:predicted cobalt transporter CbtA
VVKVYVNPDKPAEAVLDPRQRHLWIIWTVAAAMAGVAVYAVLKP